MTVIDQLNSEIWRAGIWRWSLHTLTSASGALALVDGQQDYSIGTTTGAGYYRLWRVRLTRTDVTPNVALDKDIAYGLTPTVDLEGGMDSIQAIGTVPGGTWYLNSVLQTETGLRLDRAASVPSGTTYRIDGEYQFAPVKVTSSASTIVFPDQYFTVAVEGLKWKYYQLGDDPRELVQKAAFLGELQKMKDDEDLGDGDEFRFPDSVLGAGRAGNFGLFGWY